MYHYYWRLSHTTHTGFHHHAGGKQHLLQLQDRAYHQIFVKPSGVLKTAITSPSGLFEFFWSPYRCPNISALHWSGSQGSTLLLRLHWWLAHRKFNAGRPKAASSSRLPTTEWLWRSHLSSEPHCYSPSAIKSIAAVSAPLCKPYARTKWDKNSANATERRCAVIVYSKSSCWNRTAFRCDRSSCHVIIVGRLLFDRVLFSRMVAVQLRTCTSQHAYKRMRRIIGQLKLIHLDLWPLYQAHECGRAICFWWYGCPISFRRCKRRERRPWANFKSAEKGPGSVKHNGDSGWNHSLSWSSARAFLKSYTCMFVVLRFMCMRKTIDKKVGSGRPPINDVGKRTNDPRLKEDDERFYTLLAVLCEQNIKASAEKPAVFTYLFVSPTALLIHPLPWVKC